MFLLCTQEKDESKHISTLLKHKQLCIIVECYLNPRSPTPFVYVSFICGGGEGLILDLKSSIMKTFFFCIYTYYWQLRQTDPWLMGSSSLANGAIFFLANVIVVILANGLKSLG